MWGCWFQARHSRWTFLLRLLEILTVSVDDGARYLGHSCDPYASDGDDQSVTPSYPDHDCFDAKTVSKTALPTFAVAVPPLFSQTLPVRHPRIYEIACGDVPFSFPDHWFLRYLLNVGDGSDGGGSDVAKENESGSERFQNVSGTLIDDVMLKHCEKSVY